VTAGCGCQSRARAAARTAACAAKRPATAASPRAGCTPRGDGVSGPARPARPSRASCAERRPADAQLSRTPPGFLLRAESCSQQVWEELERWGASVALVRFSGGGGNPGSISAVTLENADAEQLACWSSGEGALPEALAAPIWGRYARFRGQPRITGLLMWDVRARSIQLAGKRGSHKFDEILSTPRQIATVTIASPATNALRDTSRRAVETDTSSGAAEVSGTSRTCERCGTPLAAGLRAEARYCSKRCRQAASRARLRQLSGRAGLNAPKQCARCHGPMPSGVRPEARYCSKRCRQAASRARLVLAPRPGTASVRRPAQATSSTSSNPQA
jgi:endogenous inhibitor of DNA gyrase (YacG/DUF329 family)